MATCRFAQRCGNVVVDPNENQPVTIGIPTAPHIPTDINNHSPLDEYLPYKPPKNTGYIFESVSAGTQTDGGGLSVRDLLDVCGSNLTHFSKEYRKSLIERLRADGLNISPITCVGDLCSIIQVLVAKLGQLDEEKLLWRDKRDEARNGGLSDIQPELDRAVSNTVKCEILEMNEAVCISSEDDRDGSPRGVPVISIRLSDYGTPISDCYPSPATQWKRANMGGSI
jgi:hypothetical protein